MGTAQLRSALATAIRQDRASVLGSQYHLEEASRIPGTKDPEARRKFFDFFWQTVGWLLLRPTNELGPAEAKAGGRLQANDPFETVSLRMDLKAWCRKETTLDALAPAVKVFVENIAAAQEARRQLAGQKLAETFHNMTPADATRRWWRDADAQIDDWVNDYIAANIERLGLPSNRAQWPTPKSLPTVRAIHACLMARIVLNVGLGWNIDNGDMHDAHHYASACYADAFVVEDRAFRETLKLIPNQPVQLLTFNEFAADFGIAPS